MRVSRRLLTLALLLLLAAEVPDRKPDEEVWYEGFYHGQKTSCSHERFYRVTENGATFFYLAEDSENPLDLDGMKTVQKSRGVVKTDERFRPLSIRSRNDDEGQTTEYTARFAGDEIAVSIVGGGGVEEYRVKTAGREIFYPDSRLIAASDLKAGDEREIFYFSFGTKAIERQNVKCLGATELVVNGVRHDVMKYLITDSSLPGEESYSYIDRAGRLVHSFYRASSQYISDAARAPVFERYPDFSSYVPLPLGLPLADDLESVDFLIKIRGERPEDTIENDAYQEVVADAVRPGWARLRLFAVRPDTACDVPLPLERRMDERFLAATVQVEVGHEKIRQLAAKIVGGDTSARSAAQKIVEWVYKNIAKENSLAAQLSAVETLEAGSGDCTEHAALVCALARAAGIPARQISGLVMSRDERGRPCFGYHRWAEVFVGRWLPVDATANRFGIPPGYVNLGEHDEGRLSVIANVRSEKLFFRCRIYPCSFRRGGREIPVVQPRLLDRTEGNRFSNPFWNYSVEVPKEFAARTVFDTSFPGVLISLGDEARIGIVVTELAGPLDRKSANLLIGAFTRELRGQKGRLTGKTRNGRTDYYYVHIEPRDGGDEKRVFRIFGDNGRLFMIYWHARAATFDKYMDFFSRTTDSLRTGL